MVTPLICSNIGIGGRRTESGTFWLIEPKQWGNQGLSRRPYHMEERDLLLAWGLFPGKERKQSFRATEESSSVETQKHNSTFQPHSEKLVTPLKGKLRKIGFSTEGVHHWEKQTWERIVLSHFKADQETRQVCLAVCQAINLFKKPVTLIFPNIVPTMYFTPFRVHLKRF